MTRILLAALCLACIIACNDNSSSSSAEREIEANSFPPPSSIKGVVTGTYGCLVAASEGEPFNLEMKGSFTLSANGSYTYNGIDEPNTGRFTVNDVRVIKFEEGYFNGGEATPIEGEENSYYLVFPAIQNLRWKASLLVAH